MQQDPQQVLSGIARPVLGPAPGAPQGQILASDPWQGLPNAHLLGQQGQLLGGHLQRVLVSRCQGPSRLHAAWPLLQLHLLWLIGQTLAGRDCPQTLLASRASRLCQTEKNDEVDWNCLLMLLHQATRFYLGYLTQQLLAKRWPRFQLKLFLAALDSLMEHLLALTGSLRFRHPIVHQLNPLPGPHHQSLQLCAREELCC